MNATKETDLIRSIHNSVREFQIVQDPLLVSNNKGCHPQQGKSYMLAKKITMDSA